MQSDRDPTKVFIGKELFVPQEMTKSRLGRGLGGLLSQGGIRVFQ